MKKKYFIYPAILIALIILFWIIYSNFYSVFSDVKNMREFVLNFGALAPIVFIFLHILQILIAPIPGQVVGFAGGYIFGIWLGTLYSIIGTVLGTLVVIFLAKKLGKPFVLKMVKEEDYNKFNKFCEEKGLPFLFLIYLLPFFPDDILSFVIGLSKIKVKKIIPIVILGRLPGMFGLSLLGAGVASSNAKIAVIIVAGLVIISGIIYLFKNKLEKIMEKVVKAK